MKVLMGVELAQAISSKVKQLTEDMRQTVQ